MKTAKFCMCVAWCLAAALNAHAAAYERGIGTFQDGAVAIAWPKDDRSNRQSIFGNAPAATPIGLGRHWAEAGDDTSTPTPASAWLFGSALLGLLGARDRRQK